ncbi:hypothetical protein LZ32DRAFT_600225 [Colletotrichum eremochloae]|nr:hypothetical protein LZ32DRAFT_600225 [Colletotrichum eremochloae]
MLSDRVVAIRRRRKPPKADGRLGESWGSWLALLSSFRAFPVGCLQAELSIGAT